MRGKFQAERCALPGTFALDGEITAEFFGGESRAVQAEAVTVLSRGEPMRKDARHVFSGNAHTIIHHVHTHELFAFSNSHGHLLVWGTAVVARILRVVQQVDK